MHKVKSGTITAGPVRLIFKGIIESFLARGNGFLFISSVK